MSVIFAFIGQISDPVYSIDWYHPITVTGSSFSIEPWIFGFSSGGIASVIHTAIFNLKTTQSPELYISQRDAVIRAAKLAITGLAVFFMTFFFFHLNSLHATILSASAVIVLTQFSRPDLWKNALFTAFSFSIIAIIVYWVIDMIVPGWVESFWLYANTPHINVLSLPLDDVIWYFLAGGMIGPLYMYYQGLVYEKE